MYVMRPVCGQYPHIRDNNIKTKQKMCKQVCVRQNQNILKTIEIFP